jgi:hypothetical protein
MNKLVYIYMYVQNELVIDQIVLKSFITRLAVAMVNKTVQVVTDSTWYMYLLTVSKKVNES